MILVFKDNKGKWHLVKSLGKAGIASIGIKSYCGEGDGGDSVAQVPDDYLTRICGHCKTVVETME